MPQQDSPEHRQSDRWGKVPHALLDLPLSRQELRAFVALSCHANGKTREAHPGEEVLAAELGIHRRSVRRLLDGLQRHGVIVKQGRLGGDRTKPAVYLVAPFDGASGRAFEALVDGAFSNDRRRILAPFDGASGRAKNRKNRENRAAPARAPSGSPAAWEEDGPHAWERKKQASRAAAAAIADGRPDP